MSTKKPKKFKKRVFREALYIKWFKPSIWVTNIKTVF